MSRYSSTSSLKNAILTTFIYELNRLRFILIFRTTINNGFSRNSSPKDSRTTRPLFQIFGARYIIL
jgi:hypothetical protein